MTSRQDIPLMRRAILAQAGILGYFSRNAHGRQRGNSMQNRDSHPPSVFNRKFSFLTVTGQKDTAQVHHVLCPVGCVKSVSRNSGAAQMSRRTSHPTWTQYGRPPAGSSGNKYCHTRHERTVCFRYTWPIHAVRFRQQCTREQPRREIDLAWYCSLASSRTKP